MTHTLRYAARTDRGLLRANNQDSVYAGNRLLVVADGMGGHAAGDTASRLAVAAFAPLDDYQPGGRDLLTPLEHATDDGNEAIADMVAENPDLEGMGTTVTALLFDGSRLGIAHVGDSRAYLWRAGVLSQITHDDTFVQSLIDEGRITEAEAAIHPQRSLLLRAINGSDVEPSLINREVRVGDRYLICSDGLTGVISAEAIADTLASYDTSDAADRLIELALRGGGPDNVTVVVADVVDTGESPDPDADDRPAPLDADATGPMESMRFTRRMPRVPLPKEPDVTELAARAQAQHALTDPDDEDFGDDSDSDDAPLDAEHIGTGHPRTRKWLRRAGYLVVVVALLVIGGVLGVQWVGNQYYVGDDNGTVTVFRGVDGSVFGLRLSSAQESSCDAAATACLPLRTDDLVQAARDQVLAGIPASDLQNAREIVVRLRLQQLPLCSSLAPPVTGGPTTPSGVAPTSTPTGPTTGASPAGTVGAGTLGGQTRTTTATPLTTGTSTQAAGTAVAGSTGATASGTLDSRLATTGDTGPASTTSVAPGTTLSADPADPGVNCRIVR